MMKSKVFNLYVEQVCYLFGIEKETLFTKNKTRDVVDARHLLYYLCSIRPMYLVKIQQLMTENGYEISHSSIHHGISVVKEKVLVDKDYIRTVEEITNGII